jgi:hypothetical protein
MSHYRADDDLEQYVMWRFPAPLNSTVQAHIEACHYRAIRAVEQARAVQIRNSFAAAKPTKTVQLKISPTLKAKLMVHHLIEGMEQTEQRSYFD